ncbi:hypothetical protein D9M71_154540 [compost metagenome]
MSLGNEGAQAHRFTQFVEEGCRYRTGLFRAVLQDVLQIRRALDQLVITLAGFAQFVVEQLEQTILRLAPTQALQQFAAELVGLRRGGKRLEQGEQVRVVRILGFARCAGVGDDPRNRVLHLFGTAEQRDGVVVALRHLATIQAWQRGDALFDQRLGHGEELFALAKKMVEALADVPRHFHVLDLVATDRHLVRVEHQDVRGHQHRVAVQAHGDAGVRVFAGLDVLVHRSLVGVGAIEQALGGDAGQQPGQLGDFRDVGLAVEGHALDIQATGQPGRGDFQTRALDAQRVIALDQGVVVGQEVERIGIAVTAGDDRRADGASVVAQVRRAGGGDAGEDTGTSRHG